MITESTSGRSSAVRAASAKASGGQLGGSTCGGPAGSNPVVVMRFWVCVPRVWELVTTCTRGPAGSGIPVHSLAMSNMSARR